MNLATRNLHDDAHTDLTRRQGETKGWVIAGGDLSPELVERWSLLCASDPIYQSPFYRPEFTQAVAQVRDDVRIALFEQAGEVVGFLPFHLTRSGAAKPIGGQLNDYQGPIFAPGKVISPRELLEIAQISSYDYNHLPAKFAGLAQDAHSFSFSPQMDLSDGYNALVERKGRALEKARKDILRCSRKTERDIGPIQFTFDSRDRAAYRQHCALKDALFQNIGTRVRLAGSWQEKVLDLLWQAEGTDGFSSVFSTLHAGDELIAAHFGLRAKGTLHWWFPSYDLSARNLGPGINLLDRCAQAARDQGIRTLDFGKGSGGYKDKFADRRIDLCEGSITRPGSYARMVRLGTRKVAKAAEHLPLGRFGSIPGRAVSKLVDGVALSPHSHPSASRNSA